MRYVKVKATFRDAPDRLYRVLLVPQNVDLLRLAQIIGDAFHFEWEHLFEFRKGKTCYAYQADDEFDGFFMDIETKPIQDYDISVLDTRAIFDYDYGDGWEFNIQIYKRTVERPEEKNAIILEGAGQGIWEDEIASLYAYLDGKLDDDIEDPDDLEYPLPWNFDNEHYSDFDKPLDLKEEQEYLDCNLQYSLTELEEDENN